MMVAVNECTPQGCGSAVQYLLTDHLGSTVAVTNQSGTLTSQQRYLPFGEERAIPNSPILATDFGYTGQRLLDSGMGGIMDYKARFYSPSLMRFHQPDSIIPDPANPQAFNRFGYVLNNPIRYNDPTGHCPNDVLFIACIATQAVSQILKTIQDSVAIALEAPCEIMRHMPPKFTDLPVDPVTGTQWFGPTNNALWNHENGDPNNYDGYSQGWHGGWIYLQTQVQ